MAEVSAELGVGDAVKNVVLNYPEYPVSLFGAGLPKHIFIWATTPVSG
jgi:hypothetical protein